MTHPKSTLFLIRLWADDQAHGETWQGRIQPIGEGQAASFSDWSTLQQLLQRMLVNQQGPGDHERNGHDELPSTSFHPSPFQ